MKNFKKMITIGKEEFNSASKVIKSGQLSFFLGEKSKDFFGGPNILKFEKNIQKFYKVKHAITVNSWTSGLICAVGALNLKPGDEIILPTWTMTACAAAILHWNYIPVFADINSNTFNISEADIEKKISKRTKAIMSVDIFGYPANLIKIKKIAKKYNLKLISDCAQSPYSFINNKHACNYADIAGFSYNYHKHINTGEGGVVVTNNDNYAKRIKLIRNHGEKIIGEKDEGKNIIGYNFRLGEIEAAIGIEQLKKLKKIVKKKQKTAKILFNGLKNLKGLNLPVIEKNFTHSYYVFAMSINTNIIKTKTSDIKNFLNEKGIKVSNKYQNLHLLPIFQNKVAYDKNFPWILNKRKINYKKGICPNAEYLHDKAFIGLNLCNFDYSDQDMKFIIKCFKSIWEKKVLFF
jgi:perosamine synthetase